MALTDIELGRLKCMLEKDFVPHLPALLNNNKTPQDQITKNLSRAFSAFVLAELCHLEPDIASKMVVDDFNDCGIDAIYLHAPEQALYLVQVKLKAGTEFKESEAQAFVAGVKKFVSGEFSGFNRHVKKRQLELEGALDNCDYIKLVVAYVGEKVSSHARAELGHLTGNQNQDEQRYVHPFIEFDSTHVIKGAGPPEGASAGRRQAEDHEMSQNF